jgi:sn-glycerol 3-phosphate transport system permease protein
VSPSTGPLAAATCWSLPQLLITFVFFFWPGGAGDLAVAFIPDPFGLSMQFVGLGNFEYLFGNRFYRESFLTTASSRSGHGFSMSFALFLAVLADRLIKGSGAYRTLLIWPYAVAPAWPACCGCSCSTPFRHHRLDARAAGL